MPTEIVEVQATTQTSQDMTFSNKDIQINIGLIESVIGLIIFLFALGVGWGSLKKSVSHIEKTLDEDIKPNLKELNQKVSTIEQKVAVLWADRLAPSSSPRKLNEKGEEILKNSGIKTIVDEKKTELMKLVKQENPTNAYDAEKVIQTVMTALPEKFPELLDSLKEGAFKEGADIPTLLFVGAIYLRNQIFPDLGFKIDDLG